MPEPKRRNPILRIIPYILTTVIIGLIVWWAVSSFVNRKTTWTEGQLDTVLGYDQETKNIKSNADDEYYYVYKYNESKGYKSVVVTGSAIKFKDGKKSEAGNFVVTISDTRWDEDFIIRYADDKTPITHTAYHTIFHEKIEQWEAYRQTIPEYSAKKWAAIESTSDAFEVTWWEAWGPTIIEVGVIVLLGVFLLSRLRNIGGGGSGALDFNKSPARKETDSKVRFTDVAGCDEEKAEMVEMVDYLKDPKKYSAFGARLPKGTLLIGPPGTGKTLLAKAVAGEAGVPFFSISGSDFVEMFVGVGAGRVRDLFKQAKASAPCIIFIDEIDAVGRQRGAGLGGGNDEREQTLNQLLVEMDGFAYNSGILVIAATNRDDVLDPALLRPGRFDRIITVNLPDAAGREAILKVHARNKKISPDVDFAALSKRTVGFSGADLDNILNEAAILAVRFKKDIIGVEEIDEAIDRRIAGPAKNGKRMAEMERKQVAFHEAGHAVIGLTLPYSEKVQKITIIPRGNTGGHVLMTPEDDHFLMTKKQLLAEITGLLGGRASEEIFFDDVSTGASNDIEKATHIARMMVTEWGMSHLGPIQYERNTGSVFLGRDYADTQKNFSASVADEIDKAIREIVDGCHKEAVEILTAHKEEVKLIANTLLEKETITAEEIESLVKTGKLPEKESGTVKAKEDLNLSPKEGEKQ